MYEWFDVYMCMYVMYSLIKLKFKQHLTHSQYYALVILVVVNFNGVTHQSTNSTESSNKLRPSCDLSVTNSRVAQKFM